MISLFSTISNRNSIVLVFLWISHFSVRTGAAWLDHPELKVPAQAQCRAVLKPGGSLHSGGEIYIL